MAVVPVVGLTGGIASGKSTVSRVLGELGAEVIDADKVGHQIYLPGEDAWKDIVATFGEDVLQEDKTVNRKKLGSIVFSDKKMLEKLNQITHPRMYSFFEKRIEQIRADGTAPGIVVDAAILIEANWIPLVDEVWIVIADEDTVIERLTESGRFTAEQARARIASQLTNAERLKHADVVIENNGSIEEVAEKATRAWEELQGKLKLYTCSRRTRSRTQDVATEEPE